MNAERLLLLHYEKVAEAPDSIEQLRRFILDLAVRGKLVRQRSDEEPASELLRRVRGQKARLQLDVGTSPIGADEAPFELPSGWIWSRLGELCSKTGSGSTPRGGKSVYKCQGIPFIRSQNVHDDGLHLDDVAFIDASIHKKMAGTAVQRNDVLLNITGGSLGRCCWVADDIGEANVSQHVAIIRPAVSDLSPFMHRVILAPYFQAAILGEQTGAGRGGLPKNRMDRIPIPVPSLAEQRRIICQVDELMALCDHLEAARGAREVTRNRVAAATFDSLNTVDSPSFKRDARVALNALPALTARPDQIKLLRDAILNLAVVGRLVRQNFNDEPASELLRRITEIKTRLASKPKNRTRQNVGRKYSKPPDFALRQGWEFTDLGSIALKITDGAHKTPTYVDRGVPFVSVKDFSAGRLDLSNTRLIPETEHKRLYQRCDPRRGDILIGRIGTLGKAVLVETDIEFSLFVSVGLIRFDHSTIDPHFLCILLNSPLVVREFDRIKIGGGTHTNKLNLGDLALVSFPLPPFSEQRRIVARVDELLGLCDRLERNLDAWDSTRQRLLNALLAEALQPTEQPVA